MACTNENLNTDIAPTVELKVFAENLVRFTLRHDFSFNEALHRDEQHAGLFDEFFKDQMRKAVLVLDGIYRTEANKVFDGIEKENINIHWFTEHAIFKTKTIFQKGVDYRICLHFCVYLAILATYLYHHGIEGILDIVAQYIALLFSSIVHSNEMEPLDIVVQKYANLYHEREIYALDVHQIANESEMRALDGILLLNRASTSMRMESEIVGEHHQYANGIMDRQEAKENVIPFQTFPFCDKSQSSSEPATRQMHLANPHLDFTAIPGTSRDTNTAADYRCSSSRALDGLLLLNRASTSTRMESEIVGEHHQYANEIMDRQEAKENVIPFQTFPFCDKSQSSSEPATRQMDLGNPHLDFTAIPRTSRDTNTAADYSCSSSQPMLATNMAFKRRVSNEWGESEHNSAKKGKTDYIVSNNRVVKNFGDINMDYNAISSDDSD